MKPLKSGSKKPETVDAPQYLRGSLVVLLRNKNMKYIST